MNAYYIKPSNQKNWKGPYSYQSVLELNLPNNTFIWKEGMQGYCYIQELEMLEKGMPVIEFVRDEEALEVITNEPYQEYKSPTLAAPNKTATDENIKHASIGLRFLAWLIDSTILFCIYSFFWTILNLDVPVDGKPVLWGTLIIFSNPILYIFSCLYFAVLESSKLQATPGKILLKLKVTSENYQRVSFMNAIGRYLGKIMSGLILGIGIVMIAFTKNQQGWHDQMAKTFITRKNTFGQKEKTLSKYLLLAALVLFVVSFIISLIAELNMQ